MKKSFIRIIRTFDFLPFLTFVVLYVMGYPWKTNFVFAGALGLFFMLLHFLFFKQKFDSPFWLGIQFFLACGFLMIVFKIGWLGFLYTSLMHAMFFVALAFVSLFALIFEPKAFVNNKSVTVVVARRLSLVMVTGCIFATLVSYSFRGNFFYSAYLPFLFLLFLKDLIQVGDGGFQKRLLLVVFVNAAVLIASFAGKSVIGQYSFVSLIVLLLGKKLLRMWLRRTFL